MHFSLVVTVLTVTQLLASADALTFAVSNVTLPKGNSNMAIGAYNDSIFILGGSITTVNNQRQMTEYQIEFNNMVYYGPNYLSHDFVNYGTYYAQLGHMLYIMNEGGASLS
eukprot:699063_1